MWVRIYRSFDSSTKEWDNYTDYTDIANPTYGCEADYIGGSLPITQFSVEIHTTDRIRQNSRLDICFETGAECMYSIVDVQQMEPGTVRVLARSKLAYLDKRHLKAKYYNNEEIQTVLTDTFGSSRDWWYNLHYDLAEERITGYFPEQTARERLQQICFTIGAYLKTYFQMGTDIEIKPFGSESDYEVPIEHTYWRPQITYRDFVKSVTVRAYTYTETPKANIGSTDEWVEAGGKYYVEATQDFTLNNPNTLPNYAEQNEVEITNIRIITPTNVSALLTRLGDYYFNRTDIKADILGIEYPSAGTLVTIYTDEETTQTGYITAADYKFGRYYCKIRITVSMATEAKVKRLIIKYKWGNKVIEKQTFRFPEGAEYDIQTVFVDKKLNGHRYIFRPTAAWVSGTMGSATKTEEVPCLPALDFVDKILEIISVDEVTANEGTIRIG